MSPLHPAGSQAGPGGGGGLRTTTHPGHHRQRQELQHGQQLGGTARGRQVVNTTPVKKPCDEQQITFHKIFERGLIC